MMRMYMRYAEEKGWKASIEDIQQNDIWWIKFAMLKIAWDKVYSKLKYESGVHRVQRIPKTESQWRVHTSTITVAVMPEVDEIIDYEIDPKDIEIDFYAASSAWWQHANRNKTWVRLHHKPTGVIVSVSDNRSQLQNKEKAFNVLKARLLQFEQEKQAEEERQKRLYQVWTWDRSEKIRTYNFPQDRVTDHRIKKSYSNIPAIMDGAIDQIINDLVVEDQAMLMKESME
jgi:peptide chain release factor 1